MSLPASIPAAIIETLLLNLLPLLLQGANGNRDAARHAALQLLAAYAPRNEQELCLIGAIVSFDLHAGESLARALDPDIPIARALRLRGSAASLSREAHHYRKEIRLLQQQAAAEAPAEAVTEPPPAQEPPAQEPLEQAPPALTTEDMLQAVEEARKLVAGAARDAKQGRHAGLSYSQALRKRMTAQRLLDKQKRRAANPTARRPETGSQAALEAAVPA